MEAKLELRLSNFMDNVQRSVKSSHAAIIQDELMKQDILEEERKRFLNQSPNSPKVYDVCSSAAKLITEKKSILEHCKRIADLGHYHTELLGTMVSKIAGFKKDTPDLKTTNARDFVENMMDSWYVVKETGRLSQVHLENMADFHLFFQETAAARQPSLMYADELVEQLDEQNRLPCAQRIDKATVMIMEATRILNTNMKSIRKLSRRSRAIVPVLKRVTANTAPLLGIILADYESPHNTLKQGEEVQVTDTSNQEMWKIRTDSSSMMVPSLYVWLPPVDPEAAKEISRLQLDVSREWSRIMLMLRKEVVHCLKSYLEEIFDNYRHVEVSSVKHVKKFLHQVESRLLRDGTDAEDDDLRFLIDKLRTLASSEPQKERGTYYLNKSQLSTLQNIVEAILTLLADWMKLAQALSSADLEFHEAPLKNSSCFSLELLEGKKKKPKSIQESLNHPDNIKTPVSARLHVSEKSSPLKRGSQTARTSRRTNGIEKTVPGHLDTAHVLEESKKLIQRSLSRPTNHNDPQSNDHELSFRNPLSNRSRSASPSQRCSAPGCNVPWSIERANRCLQLAAMPTPSYQYHPTTCQVSSMQTQMSLVCPICCWNPIPPMPPAAFLPPPIAFDSNNVDESNTVVVVTRNSKTQTAALDDLIISLFRSNSKWFKSVLSRVEPKHHSKVTSSKHKSSETENITPTASAYDTPDLNDPLTARRGTFTLTTASQTLSSYYMSNKQNQTLETSRTSRGVQPGDGGKIYDNGTLLSPSVQMWDFSSQIGYGLYETKDVSFQNEAYDDTDASNLVQKSVISNNWIQSEDDDEPVINIPQNCFNQWVQREEEPSTSINITHNSFNQCIQTEEDIIASISISRDIFNQCVQTEEDITTSISISKDVFNKCVQTEKDYDTTIKITPEFFNQTVQTEEDNTSIDETFHGLYPEGELSFPDVSNPGKRADYVDSNEVDEMILSSVTRRQVFTGAPSMSHNYQNGDDDKDGKDNEKMQHIGVNVSDYQSKEFHPRAQMSPRLHEFQQYFAPSPSSSLSRRSTIITLFAPQKDSADRFDQHEDLFNQTLYSSQTFSEIENKVENPHKVNAQTETGQQYATISTEIYSGEALATYVPEFFRAPLSVETDEIDYNYDKFTETNNHQELDIILRDQKPSTTETDDTGSTEDINDNYSDDSQLRKRPATKIQQSRQSADYIGVDVIKYLDDFDLTVDKSDRSNSVLSDRTISPCPQVPDIIEVTDQREKSCQVNAKTMVYASQSTPVQLQDSNHCFVVKILNDFCVGTERIKKQDITIQFEPHYQDSWLQTGNIIEHMVSSGSECGRSFINFGVGNELASTRAVGSQMGAGTFETSRTSDDSSLDIQQKTSVPLHPEWIGLDGQIIVHKLSHEQKRKLMDNLTSDVDISPLTHESSRVSKLDAFVFLNEDIVETKKVGLQKAGNRSKYTVDCSTQTENDDIFSSSAIDTTLQQADKNDIFLIGNSVIDNLIKTEMHESDTQTEMSLLVNERAVFHAAYKQLINENTSFSQTDDVSRTTNFGCQIDQPIQISAAQQQETVEQYLLSSSTLINFSFFEKLPIKDKKAIIDIFSKSKDSDLLTFGNHVTKCETFCQTVEVSTIENEKNIEDLISSGSGFDNLSILENLPNAKKRSIINLFAKSANKDILFQEILNEAEAEFSIKYKRNLQEAFNSSEDVLGKSDRKEIASNLTAKDSRQSNLINISTNSLGSQTDEITTIEKQQMIEDVIISGSGIDEFSFLENLPNVKKRDIVNLFAKSTNNDILFQEIMKGAEATFSVAHKRHLQEAFSTSESILGKYEKSGETNIVTAVNSRQVKGAIISTRSIDCQTNPIQLKEGLSASEVGLYSNSAQQPSLLTSLDELNASIGILTKPTKQTTKIVLMGSFNETETVSVQTTSQFLQEGVSSSFDRVNGEFSESGSVPHGRKIHGAMSKVNSSLVSTSDIFVQTDGSLMVCHRCNDLIDSINTPKLIEAYSSSKRV